MNGHTIGGREAGGKLNDRVPPHRQAQFLFHKQRSESWSVKFFIRR
jgi:hypothetical protein